MADDFAKVEGSGLLKDYQESKPIYDALKKRRKKKEGDEESNDE